MKDSHQLLFVARQVVSCLSVQLVVSHQDPGVGNPVMIFKTAPGVAVAHGKYFPVHSAVVAKNLLRSWPHPFLNDPTRQLHSRGVLAEVYESSRSVTTSIEHNKIKHPIRVHGPINGSELHLC